MKKTENMCTNTAATIRLAAHEWTDRMSQPKLVLKVICRTDS